jgi:hypothetical protein
MSCGNTATDNVSKDWDLLLVEGNNGIMCLIFALFWWGFSLKQDESEEYVSWECAV